ncbi:branched-chain amino acid ABC transporter permease [Actinokineospora globicatena]|uniref:Branched-chain amino acid ABC transporter permease n=1 Tax=Actinokineospora globicatena TaxID=103729 RepID=A0A9W6V7S7_9PSEU|nr:branched-chain amino acid ABC transporter permease [Actinokineospora globicatena]MCP2306259.1 amino acid/amide ABC transporter membrane protein 1, HAAT family (TC 3.A.1.4.-) [Actinokineospora globicatena]GLW81684.1 branched-chain amino acid ABC transporter permease [Actinokineospora globicatena]GLW88479.1 branched-chain amino acid ABC transporter permease [Actinokineospora globicatena]GLW93110.1 branched-chain amino acid ABC transporter permease [Actinokineospora globicatena]
MLQLSAAIAGLVTGGAYALMGLSTLLTYRLVSVVNFAQAAVGAFGAFAMVVLYEGGLPLVLAVPAGMAVGALLHCGLGAIMVRWFSESGEGVKAAVTIAIYTGLVAVGLRLFGAQHPHRFPSPFDAPALTLGGVVVTWTAIVTMVLAVLFAAAPAVLLKRTRVGLLLRAQAERPTTAELIGIRVPRLSMIVWGIAGAASALAIMIIAPQLASDFGSQAALITPALAAVLIGAFRSFPITLLGGLALGVLQGLASTWQAVQQFRGVLPFVVILVVLVWTRRGDRWDEPA